MAKFNLLLATEAGAMVILEWKLVVATILLIPLLQACASTEITLPVAGGSQSEAKPVVTISKVGQGIFSDRYEVRVFRDRWAIYDGRANVRLIGAMKYKLSDEAYEGLMKVFDRVGFRSMNSRTSFYGHVADITVDFGSESKTVEFDVIADPQMYYSLMSDLERYLGTRQLRCPYVTKLGEKTVDLCEEQDRRIQKLLQEGK